MSNSRKNKTAGHVTYEEEQWRDMFKECEAEYRLTKNKIEEHFEELADTQKKTPSFSHEEDSWFVHEPRLKLKFFGYVLIIAIIVLYANDQILFTGILVLVFLKYLELLISAGLEGIKQNISSSIRETDAKLRQTGEIISKIKSEFEDLFQSQMDKDAILRTRLDVHTDYIELNAYRIGKLKNETSSEISNKSPDESSNNDNDEKIIEHKNWNLDTTFLLLKKISNEEFETPVPEIVLKRIVHMCDHTDKNELDEDDVKNIKNFTGSKDVINRILKALNIELFIRSIDEELEEISNTIPDGHGAVHFAWQEQKKYLKEKYNIDWLSPQDLQPDLEFF